MQFHNSLLLNFPSIGLNEIDQVKLMDRVDTKYAFTVENLNLILPKLTQEYSILEIDGVRLPTYKSLYFDDDKFTFYADHHKGKSSRFKVRIRNYVESGLFFLEIKHKWKGRVKKRRMRVDGFQKSMENEHKTFVEKYIPHLKEIAPTLLNEYNRITLVNIERQERLTLDFNLKFEWTDKRKDFDSLVIAELKQPRLDRNSFFNVTMRKMGIRPYRLSKYCIGTLELYNEKEVKHNFFKEKLLKLEKINEGSNKQ
ncbi:MAG: polyphosphate polymerase domain-containing protein [Crocinitomicaceae bacterium]